MWTELTEEEKKESLLKDAKRETANLKAQKLIAEADDDCEAILIINGVRHAFSSSQIFIPVIIGEIKEIQKAVKGRKNKWE